MYVHQAVEPRELVRFLVAHFLEITGDTLRTIFSPSKAVVVGPLSAFGAYMAGLFVIPPLDLLMWVVVAMVADYFLGMIVAAKTRTWDWNRLYDGGLGKVIRGFILVPALLLDNIILRLVDSLPSPSVEVFTEGGAIPFMTLAIIYLITAECVSIVDNIADGVGEAAVPRRFRVGIDWLRKHLGESDDRRQSRRQRRREDRPEPGPEVADEEPPE